MVSKAIHQQGSYEGHLLGFGNKAQDSRLAYFDCAKKQVSDRNNKTNDETEAYRRGHIQILDLNVGQILLHPQTQLCVQGLDDADLRSDLVAQSDLVYSKRLECLLPVSMIYPYHGLGC